VKRQIEQAIKSAGSVKAAAHRLGVSPSTLSKWRNHGVPKRSKTRAKESLTRYKDERVASRKAASAELKRLKELRKMAEGQSDVLAPVRTSEGKMDGPNAYGYKWIKAYRREMTLNWVDDMESWARSKRRRFPLWLMRFRLVQYSTDEDFAFGTSNSIIEVMVDAKDKNMFMAEHIIPTPRGKLLEVLGYARGVFEDMVETGSTIYVLTAEIFNFRMRTPAERRKRDTEYRKKNKWKKSKQKKQKKQKAKVTRMTAAESARLKRERRKN
jgi:hypothetical protein